MKRQEVSRRDLLRSGSAAFASLALVNSPGFARAAPMKQDETVIPWLDQPASNPVPERVTNLLDWEALDSWITPPEQFFSVAHYGRPKIEAQDWQLQIGGRVGNPLALTLADLKARERQEVVFTLECSGNHGFDWFTGGIGNAKWTGTPLSSLLREANILDDGIEIVFYGSDVGEETVREQKITQHFARSMSLEDAMNPQNLLCYEMNGKPLPSRHGFPLRLIAPGWYGIANVKWLQRIEVMNTRFMGRFMARDYVTLRAEQRDGETVWVERSVGRTLLKSAPARVVRTAAGAHRIDGAAWGAPIERVEVRIDDGSWQQAALDGTHHARYAWQFWSLDWDKATPGEHTITSRAIDTQGNVQPAPDDAWIEKKITYWESNGQIKRHVRIPA